MSQLWCQPLSRLFYNPFVFSNTFLGLLMINFLLNTSWVFIFDRSINHSWLLGLSSAFLILIALTNIAATAILATNIARHNAQFRRHQDLFVWGVVYRLGGNFIFHQVYRFSLIINECIKGSC